MAVHGAINAQVVILRGFISHVGGPNSALSQETCGLQKGHALGEVFQMRLKGVVSMAFALWVLGLGWVPFAWGPTLQARGIAQTPVKSVEQIFPNLVGGENEGHYAELKSMAEYAISTKKNVFELLRDVSMYLNDQVASVTFTGDDLRQLNQKYYLGDSMAEAFLPTKNVVSVSLGRVDGRAAIVILLDQQKVKTSFKYSFFSVTLHLAQSYRVGDVVSTSLQMTQGVQAESIMGIADVQRIEIKPGSKASVYMSKGVPVGISLALVARRSQ